MITLVLADDHHVIRQGLRALLESEPDFQIVGEAGDGLTALQLVESLQPAVLVTDLMMPSLSGLEVVRQVSERHQRTRVVILSMYDNESYVLEALRHGAAGYVLKGANASHLVQAVRAVSEGQRYLSPAISERAIDLYIQQAEQAGQGDRYDALTTREREVFHLAAEGHNNAEIGRQLSISPRTVETHRANMMRKLGLRSQTELIRYALRRGVLPPDEGLA